MDLYRRYYIIVPWQRKSIFDMKNCKMITKKCFLSAYGIKYYIIIYMHSKALGTSNAAIWQNTQNTLLVCGFLKMFLHSLLQTLDTWNSEYLKTRYVESYHERTVIAFTN